MNIEQLNKIQQVDPPPFLFTRIQQKIEKTYATVLPRKFACALSLSFIVVVVLNVGVLAYKVKQKNGVNSVAQSMNLVPDNELYK